MGATVLRLAATGWSFGGSTATTDAVAVVVVAAVAAAVNVLA